MCDNEVINAIVQIISTVGFPIAMCLLSFYQSNYILKENTKAIYNCTFKSLESVTRLLNNKYCFVKDTITLEELIA